MGDVVEVDSDGVVWDTSARFRVIVDVSKPLRRMQTISTSKGSALIEIKYERLLAFCYDCGVIAYIERDCLASDEEERSNEKQWGSWLCASPRRGRQRIEDEAIKFLRCARVLSFASPWRESGKETMSTPTPFNRVHNGEGTAGCVMIDKDTQAKEVAVAPPLTFDNSSLVNNGGLKDGCLQYDGSANLKEVAVAPPVCLHNSSVVPIEKEHNIASSESIFETPPQSNAEAYSQTIQKNDVSPTFLQFSVGRISPKKVRRFKTHALKKVQESIIPIHVEDCCLNMELKINTGLKRKQADEMCIDDNVDINKGLKKNKENHDIKDGSVGTLVEAAVGEFQPRPPL